MGEVVNSYLQCGHASSLLATDDSQITLTNCRLGGEEPSRAVIWHHEAYGSIQGVGISKRACYGVLAKGRSAIALSRCLLSQCSEAAVFLTDDARVSLGECAVEECVHGFVCGFTCGQSLHVHSSRFRQVPNLWFDGDRPEDYCWDASNDVEGLTAP